jgi:hypothetical protein
VLVDNDADEAGSDAGHDGVDAAGIEAEHGELVKCSH